MDALRHARRARGISQRAAAAVGLPKSGIRRTVPEFLVLPPESIREAAAVVARRRDLPEDWLNDAAKGFFLSDSPRVPVLELPNLRVWAPTAEYMLAMKCVAARFDTHDRDDVIFLVRHLGLDDPRAVFGILERYCPRGRIPRKARFLVEGLFE